MARTVDTKQLVIRELAYGRGVTARVQINGVRIAFRAPTPTKLRKKVDAALATAAAELEAAANARYDLDQQVDPPHETYDSLCEARLTVYAGRGSSKAALASNLAASRKRFGDRDPGSISRYEAEVWDVEELTPRLAASTRSHYLGELERTLAFHARHGWNGDRRNVLEGLTAERGRMNGSAAATAAPNPFESWDEVFAISGAFAWAPWGRMVRFQAALGLRPHEAVVARACDVSFDADTFTVNRTWQRARGGEPGAEVELAKTAGSRASVALTPIAREVLSELQAEGMVFGGDPDDWQHSPLLFPDPRGERTSLDWWRERAWPRALAAAGVAHRGPGQCRHTFATLQLLDMGIEQLPAVSLALRHSSVSTTQRYYLALVDELKRKSASTLSSGMPSYADHRARHSRAT